MSKQHIPVPSRWNTHWPNPAEAAEFFRSKPLADRPNAVYAAADNIITHIWRTVPKGTKFVRREGYFCDQGEEGYELLLNALCKSAWGNGYNFLDQPWDLATRLFYTGVDYGLCARKSHPLSLSFLGGLQPAYMLKESEGAVVLDHMGPVHDPFKPQLGICNDHMIGDCVSCKNQFRIMEQDIKFWAGKSAECQGCLKQQLMYVDPDHTVKRLLSTAAGRRTIKKMEDWVIQTTDTPVHVPKKKKKEVNPFEGTTASGWTWLHGTGGGSYNG